MGCYVIYLDYTILPLTDVIHIYLYVVQTHFFFFFELDHSGSQPFNCTLRQSCLHYGNHALAM